MTKQQENITISPSEINKYVYCNYQWYYQRKYGAAELRHRRKVFLESQGLDTSFAADNHLQRGKEYHDNFFKRRRFVAVLRIIFVLGIIAAVVYYLFINGVFSQWI